MFQQLCYKCGGKTKRKSYKKGGQLPYYQMAGEYSPEELAILQMEGYEDFSDQLIPEEVSPQAQAIRQSSNIPILDTQGMEPVISQMTPSEMADKMSFSDWYRTQIAMGKPGDVATWRGKKYLLDPKDFQGYRAPMQSAPRNTQQRQGAPSNTQQPSSAQNQPVAPLWNNSNNQVFRNNSFQTFRDDGSFWYADKTLDGYDGSMYDNGNIYLNKWDSASKSGLDNIAFNMIRPSLTNSGNKDNRPFNTTPSSRSNTPVKPVKPATQAQNTTKVKSNFNVIEDTKPLSRVVDAIDWFNERTGDNPLGAATRFITNIIKAPFESGRDLSYDVQPDEEGNTNLGWHSGLDAATAFSPAVNSFLRPIISKLRIPKSQKQKLNEELQSAIDTRFIMNQGNPSAARGATYEANVIPILNRQNQNAVQYAAGQGLKRAPNAPVNMAPATRNVTPVVNRAPIPQRIQSNPRVLINQRRTGNRGWQEGGEYQMGGIPLFDYEEPMIDETMIPLDYMQGGGLFANYWAKRRRGEAAGTRKPNKSTASKAEWERSAKTAKR